MAETTTAPPVVGPEKSTQRILTETEIRGMLSLMREMRRNINRVEEMLEDSLFNWYRSKSKGEKRD